MANKYETLVEKHLRAANYELVSKWIHKGKLTWNDNLRSIIGGQMNALIQTSKQRKTWQLYFRIIDAYTDMHINQVAWSNLIKDEGNLDRIDRYIKQKRYPENSLLNDIYGVPNLIQDLFIKNMSKDELTECLEGVFSSLREGNGVLIGKLINAGADIHKPDGRCGMTQFEWTSSLKIADLLRKSGQVVDRIRLIHQVMYNIVTSLAVDLRYAELKEYHEKKEFVLSSVLYQKEGYCGAMDQTDEFEMACQFMRELDIPFTTYEKGTPEIGEILSKLGMNMIECDKELAITDADLYDKQKFIKFSWTFPAQNDISPDQNIPPGHINYWCWFDHLPDNLGLWIGKYKLIA